MGARIQVLPSGRTFVAEGKSSLLEAGLSAGLALNYGCSNGNCGQCLAKVTSGTVQQVRHHDYAFAEHKKASGHVLMCCNMAVTDVVMEAPEAHAASAISRQQLTARVKSINIVNGNVALVHLKTPRANRLRFLAGQHVRLGGNRLPTAIHAISSCPCDDRNLHFQIPEVAGDAFAAYVFNAMRHGDQVDVDGPDGEFVLDEGSPRAPVFIAWRTGFGPVRSLVEHAMALDTAGSIHLVWLAAGKEDRYLDNLCRSWADALDDFSYIPVDTSDPRERIDVGRLVTKHLKFTTRDLSRHDFYIAGSHGLVDACRDTLPNLGLPPEQLKTDPLIHV